MNPNEKDETAEKKEQKDKKRRKNKKIPKVNMGAEFRYYKIPEYIKRIFASKKINADDFVLTYKTGLSEDRVFCDVYIGADKDNIYVLWGIEAVNPVTEKNIRKKELNMDFQEMGFNSFSINALSDFRIEENISHGSYIAKVSKTEDKESKEDEQGDLSENLENSDKLDKKEDNNGEYIVLFNFMFSDRRFLRDFDKYLKQLKEKGSVTFEEEKDSQQEKTCPTCGNFYPSEERKVCPHCMDKGAVLTRLFVFVEKFKGYLIIIFISLICTSLFGVLTGYISGIGLYDRVLDENGDLAGRIGLLLILIITIDIITRLVSVVYGIIMAKISAMLVYDLKSTIFESFQKLSMSFFSNRQTGGLMSQFNQDSNSVYFFLVNDVHYFFVSLFQLIVATVIMLVINPTLTLIVYVVVPLFLIILKHLRIRMRKIYARLFANTRDMSSVVTDVLQGVRVVKVFSKERDEISRFDMKSGNVKSTGLSAMYNDQLWNVVYFIPDIAFYLVWLFGGYFVTRNIMTYGLLMSFIFYMGYMLDPIWFFGNFMRRFVGTVNAIQRLFEIVDATPDVIETERPVRIKDFKGNIEFKGVEFSYEKNRKIIDNVNFTVDGGKALGIVGHTGAGKSTIANLITRLYDVEKGEISIDGVNIKDMSFDDLHSLISIVSQDTFLFMGTIAENIKYAKQNATPDEIITAAKIASAHEFIMKLPNGYETKIGHGYQDLSGGEKQRLSIARAVLKNPKILIMDEATASMDTETERQIQHSLSLLTQNRTTIIIAHRLSTLRDVDKLIVVENGKMTESGTHAELIEKKGTYYNLYTMQAKALKSIGIE